MAPRTTAAERMETAVREAVAENTRRLTAQHAKQMEDFKQQVLDVAKEVKDEQGWCSDGFRSRMEELGIDVKSTFRVSVTLRFDIEDISGEDEAVDAADEIVDNAMSGYGGAFNVGDIDISVDSAEENED